MRNSVPTRQAQCFFDAPDVISLEQFYVPCIQREGFNTIEQHTETYCPAHDHSSSRGKVVASNYPLPNPGESRKYFSYPAAQFRVREQSEESIAPRYMKLFVTFRGTSPSKISDIS